jgi:NAD(P)H-flavin reductase
MFFQHEVISNKELNSKFNSIKLRSLDKSFSFSPGQFVLFRIKDNILRAYSIASTPEDLPKWEIFVDISPSGPGTTYLRMLKNGDTVKTLNPSGQFVLGQKGGNYIFAATGCGVAPFLSMIKEIIKNKENKVFLYWGLRFNKDIALKKVLDSYSKTDKNFTYEIVLSKPDPDWKGLTGHLINPLIAKAKLLGKGNYKIYLSGSREFVRETTEALEKEKFPARKIYFESCY